LSVATAATPKHRAMAVDHARRCRIQDEPSDGIGEATAGHRETIGFGFRRALGVGRQEHLERRAVADLGIDRPRCPEAEHRRVAGRAVEGGGDGGGRRREVGGNGNLRLARRHGNWQQDQREGQDQSANYHRHRTLSTASGS